MYTDYDTMRTMLRIAHSPSTFNLRRAAFADTLLALITSFGAVNRLAERIDERIYPEQKDTPLGQPIYIVAAPRSGTTFLHRLMLRDQQFTSFKLYQTFFPTITGYKIADRLKKVNGRMGALLSAFTQKVDNQSFGGWDGIHDTGLNADEEDEALWALALATPAIWLVLPFPDQFDYLRFVDRLPAEKKQKMIAYYRGCVQRHLFLNPGKTLLSKNVLLPGRFEVVTGAVPEARFVHILRHPYEALPSMLSLFTTPWRWHSPEIRMDGPEAKALTELTIEYYRFLHTESERCAKLGEQRFATITYHELMADPVKSVRDVYDSLGLSVSPAFERELEREREQQKQYKSEHVYSLEQFGLSKDYVYEKLGDLFDFYGFAR